MEEKIRLFLDFDDLKNMRMNYKKGGDFMNQCKKIKLYIDFD